MVAVLSNTTRKVKNYNKADWWARRWASDHRDHFACWAFDPRQPGSRRLDQQGLSAIPIIIIISILLRRRRRHYHHHSSQLPLEVLNTQDSHALASIFSHNVRMQIDRSCQIGNQRCVFAITFWLKYPHLKSTHASIIMTF